MTATAAPAGFAYRFRLRHGPQFVRWRPNKAAEQCTMDQLR
jgi:hypothetical protein